MSEAVEQTKGASSAFKQNPNTSSKNTPVIGIVKNNIDPMKNGRLQVFISENGSTDSEDSSKWITVSYLSPFYGATQPSSSSGDNGEYVGNPHSYGFWATPPDINTKVLCIFINGDINLGYYIGCIPEPGLNRMIPAIGASSNAVLNEGEASNYGGATSLPVTEINTANKNISGKGTFTKESSPVHSYVSNILFNQGVIRDRIRGTISSSVQRESPSRVFGISTPGREIFSGGLTDTDMETPGSQPADKLKVVGRRGGHSIVMDDGTLGGDDQLVRFRTSSGHQILMHDTAQTISILHANGQTYVELGKEGTVDVYATNSVNVRSHADINFHADQNINIHAKKKLNMYGENVNLESSKEMTFKSSLSIASYCIKNYTIKTDAGFSASINGDSAILGTGNMFLKGAKIKLNSGSGGPPAVTVPSIPVLIHSDTLFDSSAGYMEAPGKLPSITTRAPAHMPWVNANKGVQADVSLISSTSADSTSPAVVSTIAETDVPDVPVTTPALSATVPSLGEVGGALDKLGSAALVSQASLNAAVSGITDVAKNGLSSIIDQVSGAVTAVVGPLAQTAKQLETVGIIKPGASAVVNKLVASGKNAIDSLPANLLTNASNIRSVSDVVNVSKQVATQVDSLKKGVEDLKKLGVLTGNESAPVLGGLANAAATHGAKQVADFVRENAA